MDLLERHARTPPPRVAMVGLGPSANAFWIENAQFNQALPYDEVWVVNRAAVSFQHDLAFHMHDLRQLVRKYPMEAQWLGTATRPIMTLAHYPEFPTTVAYPIQAVIDLIKHDILNSTPAYMVAYAMLIGVREILLFGMDFHYQNMDRAEAGGQGMAYMLGMCQAAGLHYRIPNTSSLLDAYKVQLVNGVPMRPLYGYNDSPETRDPRHAEGAKVVTLAPPEHLMTAKSPPYRLGDAEQGDAVPAMADGRG